MININDILNKKIEKKSDALEIVRFIQRYRSRENVYFDETMKEKERLAFRFLNTGCLTNLTLISYVKKQKHPLTQQAIVIKCTIKVNLLVMWQNFKNGIFQRISKDSSLLLLETPCEKKSLMYLYKNIVKIKIATRGDCDKIWTL